MAPRLMFFVYLIWLTLRICVLVVFALWGSHINCTKECQRVQITLIPDVSTVSDFCSMQYDTFTI